MKETKNRAPRDIIVVGFALFSMFFGAGNVIFPPYLGMESGPQWLAGFSAYFIADIGLALAAMFALLRVGSSEAVLQRVGRVPSEVLMCAIILCVGPMVAIPRTSASTFEMAIAPNLPGVSAVVFSVLFFALILALCIRESAVVDIVGKVLTPLLLVGLAAIIIKGVVTPPGTIAPEAKIDSAVVTGVKAGYQTMDALAALNFGAVIAMNIRAQGVAREQDVQRSAIRAGLVAGGLLLVVYTMLGHAGALTGAAVPGLATGAEVLTVLAERLFGKAGLVLLAAIFMLACFNTCVGLIACVGEYFHTLLPRIPYPALAAFFAAASMLIANLGLAEILRLSIPVLNALYPVAIVLIVLSFVPELEQRRRVYPLCIGCTAVQSIAAALPLSALSALANALPLAALGFGWVLPAVIGLLAGIFLSCTEE